ncbi:MAG: 3-oxoacyl-ACP synthase III [Gemmataceae bacterium]|nr:3-oxoacyl-ACP synthase III [Gemmataceae bacterium]
MRYSKVFIDAIGYELPPVVVSTAELEARLAPLYKRLYIPQGQLEAWTGIHHRRWWEAGYPLSEGALAAARQALGKCDVPAEAIDVVIYAGVCREQIEPATACTIAAGLGVSPGAAVYDLSNACLGVLNGIVDIANRIELGQIRAGLVVSCETAREINEAMIECMLRNGDMETFKTTLATLTGGSGAAAVVVTDGSFATERRRQLIGGETQNASQHHALCRWGFQSIENAVNNLWNSEAASRLRHGMDYGLKHCVMPFMNTDAINVLKYGVDLGMRTWKGFGAKLGWAVDSVDRVICHQVGSSHRDSVLKALGIPIEKDFSTFPFLGNIGTASLPITAALAEEDKFLRPGDRVGFLGIGSGLNCLMLGVQW